MSQACSGERAQPAAPPLTCVVRHVAIVRVGPARLLLRPFADYTPRVPGPLIVEPDGTALEAMCGPRGEPGAGGVMPIMTERPRNRGESATVGTTKGTCDDRFDAVQDALEGNLASGEELGASVHVDLDGETVVDPWGGWRDEGQTMPWTEDTITNVWSCTKTVTSLAALVLKSAACSTPTRRRNPLAGVRGGRQGAC